MTCFKPKACIMTSYMNGAPSKLTNWTKSTAYSRKKLQALAENLNNNCSCDKLGESMSYSEQIEVGCRKCIGCRLDKAREWAERIMLECESSNNCYFVTFTIDDEHMNDDFSLCKKEFADFLKNLRQAVYRNFGERGVRFYMCGEYGRKNLRPHYHVIFFNLPIDDLVPFQYGQSVYYRSAFLEKYWKKGFVVVGEVTFNSAGYVARYTMKKANNFLVSQGCEPEYTNMSRKPGIGRIWFDNHWLELYERDGVYMKSSGKVSLVRPASYFDKLMKQIDPDRLSDIKLNRRFYALHALHDRLSKTTLNLDDQRLVDLENLLLKTKSLDRIIES